MLTQIKSPALAGGSGLEKQIRANDSTSPKKWKRVLAFLLTGESANRFEAERRLNDHTLPSTVSSLQAKGLTIDRRDEIVAGFQGAPTHVCRYKLAPESYTKARELLGLPAAAPGEHATAEGWAS